MLWSTHICIRQAQKIYLLRVFQSNSQFPWKHKLINFFYGSLKRKNNRLLEERLANVSWKPGDKPMMKCKRRYGSEPLTKPISSFLWTNSEKLLSKAKWMVSMPSDIYGRLRHFFSRTTWYMSLLVVHFHIYDGLSSFAYHRVSRKQWLLFLDITSLRHPTCKIN